MANEPELQMGQRKARARRAAGAGKRLTAEDLRMRGVDEAFLTAPQLVDAEPLRNLVPADAELQQPAFEFVPSQAVTHVACGAVVPAVSETSITARKRLEQEPEWSAKKLQKEYGLGYALLVRMGYQGGGRIPLCGVKRQARVGLQDNEDLALDPVTAKKSKRQHGHGAAGLSECEMLPSKEEIQGVEEAESDENELPPLAEAVLQELRCTPSGHILLSTLSKRAQIRRVLVATPYVGKRMERFLRRYVRAEMQEYCQVSRSTRLAWKSISGSSSTTSWSQVARRQTLIRLRVGNDSGASCESTSSSDDCRSRTYSPCIAFSDDQNEELSGGKLPAIVNRCHGCGQNFTSRTALRSHIADKIAARTTRDPTDLRARFDPDHADREILQVAAATFTGCRSHVWICPVCSVHASCFLDLLDHTTEVPRQRIEHQRVLQVVAEVLAEEPPPACVLKEPRDRKWSSPILSRLFNSFPGLASESNKLYRALEDELLGCQEDDMFGSTDDMFGSTDDIFGSAHPAAETTAAFGPSLPNVLDTKGVGGRVSSRELYGPDVPENPSSGATFPGFS
eukprot:TRINITY_DN33908_c0_g1_i1.p1 TRINITY_DN33908_c0_g1~~TRINITY_DN33908_c0_g1_i1.p1  ORF type:complete len:567 (-),score=100.84 TRINITY_DN33908_c0_g1_i1:28-1728(-)